MRTLIIKSSEWLRGGGDSYLFNGRRYCCLGLDARACGVADTLLELVAAPDVLDYNLITGEGPLQHWVTTPGSTRTAENTPSCVEAMRANDLQSIDDEERIALLRPIFAREGIELDWRPNE